MFTKNRWLRRVSGAAVAGIMLTSIGMPGNVAWAESFLVVVDRAARDPETGHLKITASFPYSGADNDYTADMLIFGEYAWVDGMSISNSDETNVSKIDRTVHININLNKTKWTDDRGGIEIFNKRLDPRDVGEDIQKPDPTQDKTLVREVSGANNDTWDLKKVKEKFPSDKYTWELMSDGRLKAGLVKDWMDRSLDAWEGEYSDPRFKDTDDLIFEKPTDDGSEVEPPGAVEQNDSTVNRVRGAGNDTWNLEAIRGAYPEEENWEWDVDSSGVLRAVLKDPERDTWSNGSTDSISFTAPVDSGKTVYEPSNLQSRGFISRNPGGNNDTWDLDSLSAEYPDLVFSQENGVLSAEPGPENAWSDGSADIRRVYEIDDQGKNLEKPVVDSSWAAHIKGSFYNNLRPEEDLNASPRSLLWNPDFVDSLKAKGYGVEVDGGLLKITPGDNNLWTYGTSDPVVAKVSDLYTPFEAPEVDFTPFITEHRGALNDEFNFEAFKAANPVEGAHWVLHRTFGEGYHTGGYNYHILQLVLNDDNPAVIKGTEEFVGADNAAVYGVGKVLYNIYDTGKFQQGDGGYSNGEAPEWMKVRVPGSDNDYWNADMVKYILETNRSTECGAYVSGTCPDGNPLDLNFLGVLADMEHSHNLLIAIDQNGNRYRMVLKDGVSKFVPENIVGTDEEDSYPTTLPEDVRLVKLGYSLTSEKDAWYGGSTEDQFLKLGEIGKDIEAPTAVEQNENTINYTPGAENDTWNAEGVKANYPEGESWEWQVSEGGKELKAVLKDPAVDAWEGGSTEDISFGSPVDGGANSADPGKPGVEFVNQNPGAGNDTWNLEKIREEKSGVDWNVNDEGELIATPKPGNAWEDGSTNPKNYGKPEDSGRNIPKVENPDLAGVIDLVPGADNDKWNLDKVKEKNPEDGFEWKINEEGELIAVPKPGNAWSDGSTGEINFGKPVDSGKSLSKPNTGVCVPKAETPIEESTEGATEGAEGEAENAGNTAERTGEVESVDGGAAEPGNNSGAGESETNGGAPEGTEAEENSGNEVSIETAETMSLMEGVSSEETLGDTPEVSSEGSESTEANNCANPEESGINLNEGVIVKPGADNDEWDLEKIKENNPDLDWRVDGEGNLIGKPKEGNSWIDGTNGEVNFGKPKDSGKTLDEGGLPTKPVLEAGEGNVTDPDGADNSYWNLEKVKENHPEDGFSWGIDKDGNLIATPNPGNAWKDGSTETKNFGKPGDEGKDLKKPGADEVKKAVSDPAGGGNAKWDLDKVKEMFPEEGFKWSIDSEGNLIATPDKGNAWEDSSKGAINYGKAVDSEGDKKAEEALKANEGETTPGRTPGFTPPVLGDVVKPEKPEEPEETNTPAKEGGEGAPKPPVAGVSVPGLGVPQDRAGASTPVTPVNKERLANTGVSEGIVRASGLAAMLMAFGGLLGLFARRSKRNK